MSEWDNEAGKIFRATGGRYYFEIDTLTSFPRGDFRVGGFMSRKDAEQNAHLHSQEGHSY